MSIWASVGALCVFACGFLVSGRLIFLLNHRSRLFKTIDFVILGGVALVTLVTAFAIPFLIFYNVAGGGER
jgi:hypothetical protein